MTENNSKDKAERVMDELREKIDALALIEALELHVLGQSKMTATQVSAALALLRKTLPDLLSVPVQKLLKQAELPKAHEEALKELE